MSKKGKGGRPSKYDPKYHPQLVKWMARCGKTQAEIAEELEISEPTLYAWEEISPESKPKDWELYRQSSRRQIIKRA